MRIQMCWEAILNISESIRENRQKITKANTKYLKFRFKNKIGRNESNYNVKLGSRLINKVNIFEQLGSIMQENEGILEDVTSRNRREATEVLCDKKSTIKDLKNVINLLRGQQRYMDPTVEQ